MVLCRPSPCSGFGEAARRPGGSLGRPPSQVGAAPVRQVGKPGDLGRGQGGSCLPSLPLPLAPSPSLSCVAPHWWVHTWGIISRHVPQCPVRPHTAGCPLTGSVRVQPVGRERR